MKTKTLFLLPALIIIALFATIQMAFAQTELLTFDNLTFGGLYEQIPDGYGGLQWNNFEVLNTVQEASQFGTNGDVNGVVSPPNDAFNDNGNEASISDGAFDLNSAYLMAAWNDGLQVEVQGFVGTTLTYDNTYTVNTQGSTLIDFNYLDVDEVNFISSGGTPHGFAFGRGTQFGMDNLSITIVPEPSTWQFIGLAAILLILCRLIPRFRMMAAN